MVNDDDGGGGGGGVLKENLCRCVHATVPKVPWHIEACNTVGGRYTRLGRRMRVS